MKTANKEELQALLDKCSLIILDLDGTLYRGSRLFPGSGKFLNSLLAKNKKRVFFSNNTSRSTGEYLSKLNDFGFTFSNSEFYNALDATFDYLRREELYKVEVIGTDAVVKDFEREGFSVKSSKPEALVLTYDTSFTYEKLVRGYEIIQNGGRFIATHPDVLCPTENGFVPDIACLIASFRAFGAPEPEIVGKPFKTMIQPVLKKNNVSPSECLLIGDRLYTDIRMAVENGVNSVLVLTGESHLGDVIESEWKPDLIARSVVSFIE